MNRDLVIHRHHGLGVLRVHVQRRRRLGRVVRAMVAAGWHRADVRCRLGIKGERLTALLAGGLWSAAEAALLREARP